MISLVYFLFRHFIIIFRLLRWRKIVTEQQSKIIELQIIIFLLEAFSFYVSLNYYYYFLLSPTLLWWMTFVFWSENILIRSKRCFPFIFIIWCLYFLRCNKKVKSNCRQWINTQTDNETKKTREKNLKAKHHRNLWT